MSVDRPPPRVIGDERRKSTMETARLEHAILQTVINHIAEHRLSRPQVVMALINVAGYWQKKIILTDITKKLIEELNADS